MLRDEVMWAWTPPPYRDAINRLSYGFQSTWKPGGAFFVDGLSDWEARAIAEPPFPRTGRLLLPAAGGGRELAVLCRMGYQVVAFEPSPRLYEGLRTVGCARCVKVRASFADLARPGPLTPHLAGGFDGVIIGLASFNHILTEEERVGMLASVRAVAPDAPVLLSFVIKEREQGRVDRLRPPLRRVFRLLGAPGKAVDGDVFWRSFSHIINRDELESTVRSAGYRMSWLRLNPFGHALLARGDSSL
jgi:hypothetical protein